MTFLLNFRDFGFSFMGVGLKMKTQKSQNIFIFWIHQAQMHVDLFFEHYFNSLSIRTNRTKRDSKAVKTQMPAI